MQPQEAVPVQARELSSQGAQLGAQRRLGLGLVVSVTGQSKVAATSYITGSKLLHISLMTRLRLRISSVLSIAW